MASASLITTLRHRVEATGLATAVFLFRLIPVDAASASMGFLWQLFAPLNRRHKRALKHLEAAMPETTSSERNRIIGGMWNNLGRVTAETFHINELAQQDHRIETCTDELTQKVLAGEQPCIFVSLHSGNWELCVQPAMRAGINMAGVYQALKNPITDRMLRDMRKDLYQLGLYSKGHQTARRLLSTVRQGGVVAIMGDLRETRGIKVPFFGLSAYATPVPVSLARTCGVPIVLGRVVRKDGVQFMIEGQGLEVPVTDDRKADIEAATVEIHRVFEGWIREYPEQWMWIHRKWAQI